MELLLQRGESGPTGTNGVITSGSLRLCYTIERPWLNNTRRMSCVPPGRYQLTRRTSKKFGQHLLLNNVPGRDLILIHAANVAMRDLLGCIGPVTKITGIGEGVESRAACKSLFAYVFARLDAGQEVWLTIS